MDNLVGKSHIFPDGAKIEVMQIKIRDEGELLVTYHVSRSNSIPQKLVMNMTEFLSTFGHLFRPKKETTKY